MYIELIVVGIVVVWLYLRYLAPLRIRWIYTDSIAVPPQRVAGKANSFILFATDNVQILPINGGG